MPPIVRLSKFEEHKARWTDGCGATICPGARNKCFARGSIPCDVLFIGEAPGESEDVLGRPFCGPAGHLMDDIVRRALGHLSLHLAFTNLVLCIPRNDGDKADEPMPEDIKSCAARLRELVSIARPRLLVCVGTLARDWLDLKRTKPRGAGERMFFSDLQPEQGPTRVDIIHPAAILRMNVAQKSLEVQRCVVRLRNYVEEHFGV